MKPATRGRRSDPDRRAAARFVTREGGRAQSPAAPFLAEDKATVAARWLALGVFVATPFGLLPGTFISHDVMPKLVIVMCGAGILMLLLPRWIGGVRQLSGAGRGRWFLWLVAAQIAVLTLSTVFSNRPLLSLAGTTWRRFGMAEQVGVLVIAVAVASFAAMKPDSVRVLWRAVAASGGIISLYAIAQYFGIDPWLERRLYAIDYLGGIVRPPGTMGHAIYLASWLTPVALMAAWQARMERKRMWRAMHGAVALLGAVAILVSGSRGALLGLAAGGGVLLLAMRPSKKIIGAGAGVVGVVAAFVAFAPAGGNLRHRIAQWREDPGTVRMAVWRESPALIAKAPLLGSGPETFAGAFRQVQSAELSRRYPDFINETPHNVLIDAACELGITGLAVLAGVFVLLLTQMKSAGIRAAAAGMLVCGFFASFSIMTAMYLWEFAGIAAAEDVSAPNDGKSAAWWWILTPAGIAMIAFAVILGVQDHAYKRVGEAVDSNDLSGAKQALRTATLFGLGMPGYELWSSQQMSRFKAWKEATESAALAERRSEEPALAAYQLAILRIVDNDAVGAETRAAEAVALAPNWYKPHLLRAQILQAIGRNGEAAREIQLARSLGWKEK